MPQFVDEAVLLHWSEAHASLAATLLEYRDLLEQHGIQPPDDEGKDALQLWRNYLRISQLTYEFIQVVCDFVEEMKKEFAVLRDKGGFLT